ncbi:MAG TPA: DUF4396 domain-containing protein [Chloroflexota bacterium]|jgi:hypothetical protein
MIAGVLLLWDVLTIGALLFLVWDLWTNTPTTWVMKLAWILVIAYTGPVGLFIYLLSCRQPLPGTHEAFIAAHWKQSVGSLMHCVAGDATGIILAAVLLYRAALPSGINLILEYAAGFLVGLLVFQALFRKLMTGEPYVSAVRQSFFPETVSMNMVMLGMIPTKFALMHQVPGSDNPTTPLFWGIMSVATMVGMLTAYPINSWMVGRGIKHGMMSAMPAPKHGPPGQAPSTPMAVPARPAPEAMAMPMQHGPMRPVPASVTAGVLLGTTAVFIFVIWATSWFVPLKFT